MFSINSIDVAEGAGRNTDGEFRQFLGIANGSSYELQTEVIIAKEPGFVKDEQIVEVLDNVDELQKMNYNLQKRLKTKIESMRPA